jgi:hypothetical protein
MDISNALFDYDLVCLAVGGSFQVSENAVKIRKECLSMGRALFLEALDEAAPESFQGLLDALDRDPQP